MTPSMASMNHLSGCSSTIAQLTSKAPLGHHLRKVCESDRSRYRNLSVCVTLCMCAYIRACVCICVGVCESDIGLHVGVCW